MNQGRRRARLAVGLAITVAVATVAGTATAGIATAGTAMAGTATAGTATAGTATAGAATAGAGRAGAGAANTGAGVESGAGAGGAGAGAADAGGAGSGAAGAESGAGVRGVLLAVPDRRFVRAVDVNELGVVVGNATSADPSYTDGVTGQRWIPLGRRYLRQTLQTPAGASGVSVTGVNRIGEPAGTAGTGGDYETFRAVRWPVTGVGPVYLGEANSQVSAVGDSAWGVAHPTLNFIAGTGEIVTRDGTRTSVNDFPELPGRIRTVARIGAKDTAVVTTVNGVGGGTNGSVGVVQGGRVTVLPVRALIFFGSFCTSAMRADGTVAYSGYSPSAAGFTYYVSVHHGGVPGTEQNLPTGGRIGSLGCDTSDTLASDGTVAGYLDADDTHPEEAAVWSGGTLTDLGVPSGFTRARAVGVATGGRVVVLASGPAFDDPKGAFLIKDGVSSPLTTPAGWSLVDIVELTDRGLVVGNVTDAAGRIRPIIWRT